jgi:hypothetical protein
MTPRSEGRRVEMGCQMTENHLGLWLGYHILSHGRGTSLWLTMSFTTPTYLAAKTASSNSLEQSRKRVISLYRQWQRAVGFRKFEADCRLPRLSRRMLLSSPYQLYDHESVRNLRDIDMFRNYQSLMSFFSRDLQGIRLHQLQSMLIFRRRWISGSLFLDGFTDFLGKVRMWCSISEILKSLGLVCRRTLSASFWKERRRG